MQTAVANWFRWRLNETLNARHGQGIDQTTLIASSSFGFRDFSREIPGIFLAGRVGAKAFSARPSAILNIRYAPLSADAAQRSQTNQIYGPAPPRRVRFCWST